MEERFGLLPVESPGESIVFLPQFVAIVGTTLFRTSIWVSLYGDAHQFDKTDTVPGRFPHWRKFHVENRSADIERAKVLIERALENYKAEHRFADWDDIIALAELRWIEARDREKRKANRERMLREL